MNIKKIFFIQILMFNTITQPYNLENEDIKKITTHGIIVTSVCALTYLWATSGKTVEQKIKDAHIDLATMPEYDKPFDMTIGLGEKETQIKKNLEQLQIDINNLTKNFNQKLLDDLATITETYNNLWFKSFYGGTEIAQLTRKVYETKTKIEALIKYLNINQEYIHGHQIIQEINTLINRNTLENINEIIKIAENHDKQSTFPLYNYVKKIQKDLACIASLTTEKNNFISYPELSKTIAEFEPILVKIKNIITATESYKNQAFNKLEYDVAQITEQYQKLEQLIKKIELDIAILKMRS